LDCFITNKTDESVRGRGRRRGREARWTYFFMIIYLNALPSV
jgi:hypothetical protein